MKEIQELSDRIEDEIHDAKKYAKLAMKYKTENPTLAKLYHTLSLEETRHMNMLHDAVTRMITEYRDQKGDPPPVMQARYEYLHDMHIKQASKVHYLQTMFDN